MAELRHYFPFEASAASDRLGWVGLQAARYQGAPAAQVEQPALNQHTLIHYHRPPEELELSQDGVTRQLRPLPGSISVLPAGLPAHWRWSGSKDVLHVYLEPGLVERVALEAFGFDPARITVAAQFGRDLPQIRAALVAVEAALAAGDGGGRLAAASLANVLAVELIRPVLPTGRLVRGRAGALPRDRLRAVLDYIEDHQGAVPTLQQLAAIAHLSVYHFARQFKAATGLPPHQYVLMRRIEQSKLLLDGGERSLAEIAADAGFADQSQFSRQFKRLVGVSPRQFRKAARNA